MSDQSQTEEIPHHHVIAELQLALNARTADLVVAGARIRHRDERIAALEGDLVVCHQRLAELEGQLHDPPLPEPG